AMNDYCCLAGWRRQARNVALTLESPDNLHTEVNRHDRWTFVVLEKDVETVGSQTGMLAEESPHGVKRRFKCRGNILYRDAAPHRSENAGRNRFHFYFIHRHKIDETPRRCECIPAGRSFMQQTLEEFDQSALFFSGKAIQAARRFGKTSKHGSSKPNSGRRQLQDLNPP